MVNIKVVHKEAARRFQLPSEASWIDLEAKLRSLFEIPALTPFTLSYTDEDNDVITLSTDIELREIFANNPTIKFNLKFSAPDDLSDSEDSNNEVWVFEGGNISPSKQAIFVTTNETDNSGPQDNVPRKNIVSTTNQEPQYIENDENDVNYVNYVNETLNKKLRMDDDFEKVERSSSDCKMEEKLQSDIEEEEKSPNDIEEVEKSPNDIERVEKSPNDIERVEKSSNDIERVGKSPNDIERVEKSPNDIERVEKSPNDIERVEKSSYDIERVEKSPNANGIERMKEKVEKLQTDVNRIERSSNDFDRVERSSNDLDRVENSPIKKAYQVNLLDDDFFESFNSFKISPTLSPFEPKPQREVEDEQRNRETIGTSSSSNTSVFSPFSERIQPQRRQDKNDTIEQFKDMIEQYQDYIKEDPQLIRNVMDQIRSSIPADLENLNRLDSSHRLSMQPKEGKRNAYFRQPRSGHNRSSTPPIPGRSRSATPPRFVYNRPSTPSRSSYNHLSTPPTSGYDRPSTPPMPGYDRPSTPPMLRSTTPPIPGSFPVPSSTPCLWVNEPDSNTNQKNTGGRKGRGRNRRNYRNRNQNQNMKLFTKDEEETLERESSEPQEINKYSEEIKQLNEMGFENYRDEYLGVLARFDGDMDLVTNEFVSRLL